MNPKRLFWISIAIAIFLLVSIFVSSRRLKEARLPEGATSIPASTANGNANAHAGSNGQAATVVVDAPKESPTPTDSEPTPEPQPTVCRTQHEFLEIRRELGLAVNKNHEIREKHKAQFIGVINDFKKRFGLPFPLAVTSGKAEEQNVVYNNCKPACKGTVNIVFVARVIGSDKIEVLTKDGTLAKLPLRDTGIDVSTVDELNAKGVPFRTWRAPVATEFYVEGTNLYVPMDIEGLSLRINPKSQWDVVVTPQGLTKLTVIEPAAKIAGCVTGEHCFEAVAGRQKRHFKAPIFCNEVVKHAADEPAEDKPDEPAAKPKADRNGPGGYQ